MSEKHPAEVLAIRLECSEFPRMYAIPDACAMLRRIPALEAELERERIRLAACGVVAMCDTPESAARNRQMHPDYESESCRDVARRVDECMALRAERDQLRAWIASAVECIKLSGNSDFYIKKALRILDPAA